MNANVKAELRATENAGLLTPRLLAEARGRAASTERPLLEVLREDLAVDGATLASLIGAALGLDVVSMGRMSEWRPAFERLSFGEAVQRGCIAFDDGTGWGIVVSNPFDEAQTDWCNARLGLVPQWWVAQAEDIAAFLARHEDSMRAIDSALPTGAAASTSDSELEDLSIRSIGEGTSVVVRLVQSTLYDALKSGASDIHIESHLHGLVIKYRLDGMLIQVGAPEGRELAEQVLSRLKVMAELDIAERRIPQDGRFRLRALGREIDFRVSIMPSIHGEDAVVRVLDKQAMIDQAAGLRLDILGFDDSTLAAFRRLSRDPYGLLLVTGPTGSGKTTTLYAALSEINHGNDKIITIEDPVEYQLPGILQIPVNEKKGLTFSRGLRSILRHDPDRIMVGEIRDPDTAQIAIQAALTGHLVLSTVHANNAFDVIGRFTHMDVDPYSFVSALSGVLAQRLLRLNCTHCAVPVSPSPRELEDSLIDPARARGRPLRAGEGCGKCRGTGYKGRKAVGELLVLDDELRELVVARAPVRQIKEAALRKGTRFLRDAAVELFLEGHTSLAEVNRVTLAS
jgi:general secretion pathway protein E